MTLSYQRLSHPKNKEMLSLAINKIYDIVIKITLNPIVTSFKHISLHSIITISYK